MFREDFNQWNKKKAALTLCETFTEILRETRKKNHSELETKQ